MIVAKSVKLD